MWLCQRLSVVPSFCSNLSGNLLTSLPDRAFEDFTSLKRLLVKQPMPHLQCLARYTPNWLHLLSTLSRELHSNRISRIGPFAFAGLSNLTSLWAIVLIQSDTGANSKPYNRETVLIFASLWYRVCTLVVMVTLDSSVGWIHVACVSISWLRGSFMYAVWCRFLDDNELSFVPPVFGGLANLDRLWVSHKQAHTTQWLYTLHKVYQMYMLT